MSSDISKLRGFAEEQVKLLGAVVPKLGGFVFEATVEIGRVEAHKGFERRYAQILRPQLGHAGSLPMEDKMEISLGYFRHVTASERTNLRQPSAAGVWKSIWSKSLRVLSCSISISKVRIPPSYSENAV